MPEAVIYWSARDTHNAKGVVAVQLEPESAPFDLRKKREQNGLFKNDVTTMIQFSFC